MKSFILVAALAAPLALLAGYEDMGLGSRPQGMGGAFVALADDSNALYWNPAGLVQVRRQEALFMHGLYGGLSGINFDYLAYVYPMEHSAIGVGWSETGATLEEGDGPSAVTSRINEDIYYISMGLSPSLFGISQFTVGGTIKRLTLDTVLDSGSGLGFDGGALYKPYPWLQAGLMLRNVATDVRNEKYNMTVRFGLASRLFTDTLHLAVDMTTKDGVGSANGTSYKSHFGLEYAPYQLFAGRVGYDDGNMTAGFGVSYSSFKIDYSYKASELVGNAHRVSLGMNFGPESAGAEKKVAPAAKAAEPVKEAAPLGMLAPAGLKGAYTENRVRVTWDSSASVGVAGYNLYRKNTEGAWTKVNETLVPDAKRSASIKGKKGQAYKLAVTTVGVDKSESPKSEELSFSAQ